MFDALIIDGNLESRAKLKQAAHAGKDYHSVFAANALSEALARLKNGETFDVIFISRQLGQQSISQFIKDAKQTRGGSDTAYIMLLQAADNDPEKLAQNLVSGIDGFLIDPFSVDNVSEIARIADKVKLKNAESRMIAASDIVVSSMISEIDRRADALSHGKKARPVRKQLKEATQQFKLLAGQALGAFFSRTIDMFSGLTPPPEEGYHGASLRVKRMYEEKQKDKAEQKVPSTQEEQDKSGS